MGRPCVTKGPPFYHTESEADFSFYYSKFDSEAQRAYRQIAIYTFLFLKLGQNGSHLLLSQFSSFMNKWNAWDRKSRCVWSLSWQHDHVWVCVEPGWRDYISCFTPDRSTMKRKNTVESQEHLHTLGLRTNYRTTWLQSAFNFCGASGGKWGPLATQYCIQYPLTYFTHLD